MGRIEQITMVDLAPAHVDKERAELLRRWLADPEISEPHKEWVRRWIEDYKKLPRVGDTMAYSFVWSVMGYFLARPDKRAQMTARGKALCAKLEWSEWDRRNNKKNLGGFSWDMPDETEKEGDK